MKKLSLLFISFMFVGIGALAQEAEYVVKKDFQEKTTILGAQVNSVKRLSSSINTELTSVKETVAENQIQIKTVEASSNENSAAFSACKAEIENEKAALLKAKKKTKLALIISLLLIILSAAFTFSIKNRLTKKLAATQKQIDETNNMLIEQGKSLEKKISTLNDNIKDIKKDKEKK